MRGRSEAEVKNLLDAAHRAVAGRKPQIERVDARATWKSSPLAVPVSPVLYLVMPIREWSRK
jgi:hypothetical protein